MGQVPNQNSISQSHIGIVGRGRAAKHLSFYFESMGIRVQNWIRSDGEDKLQELTKCSAVLLAIPDSQVDDFLLHHPYLLKTQVLHLSGALTTIIRGVHPLASFGSHLFDLETYKKIPFVVEEETPYDFTKYFPQLPNPVFKISREQKAKYHAYCVAANNFTTLLWQKYFSGLQTEYSIPPEASRSLFKTTFLNLNNDWKNALTGPLARGDQATIQKNMRALEGDKLQNIYKAFVENELRKEKIQIVRLEPGEMGL